MAAAKWTRTVQRILRKLVPLLALPLIGLVYFLGVRSERTGFVDEVLDPGLKRITRPVLNAFRGKPPAVPQLLLQLDEAVRDSLAVSYERALDEGRVEADGNARFTAKATANGRELSTILALREGPLERTPGERWPLHVRLATNDTLLGMRTFDLTPVTDERQLLAWLFQRTLADQGLPALGHGFTEVRLNGRDLGLYAMEGRVDSVVLAGWGRGQGPVARFDDGMLTNAMEAMEQRRFPSKPPPQGDWMSAPIMASRPALLATDRGLASRYQRTVFALDGFRAGRLSASEVFDVEALGKLLALCDMLGGQEAGAWRNLRFLADSTTGKLIIFPQRGFSGRPIASALAMRTSAPVRFGFAGTDFLDRLLGDSLVYVNYITHLDTFSAEGWLEGLLERIGPALDLRERIVAGEYPHAKLDRTVFEHDRTVVRQTLRPKDVALAYTQGWKEGKRRLAAANTHALPLLATAMVAGDDTLPLARPAMLWPRDRDKPLTYSVIALPEPPGGTVPSHLIVRVVGLPEQRPVPIRTWSTFSAN